MFIVAGIIIMVILIIALEMPDLKRNGSKKEMWLFSFLLLFGVGLSIAQSFKLNIPNPVEGITFVFKPFSDFLYSYLLN